jgi:NAD+ synthase
MSTTARPLDHQLKIDPADAVRRIAAALRDQVFNTLHHRGLVVAMSGGVDSSVCAALAVRTVGVERVFGLVLPEQDSDPQSAALARRWAESLGIAHCEEDIAPLLHACGCYRRRDDAIRRVVPEYGAGWRCKIVMAGGGLDSDRINLPQLVVQGPPPAAPRTVRLPAVVYREIVAATNFKQRVRKMLEYYHADRLQYAVLGTPNRLEYDQGFFVKGGDGLADVKPIAHLYKSQVYQLAEYLAVPRAIYERPPTTDTFSLPQTQEEFYFALPTRALDLVLHARNAGLPATEIAGALGLRPDQAARAYADIARKRAAAVYLHSPPLLVEPVPIAPPPASGPSS